MMPTDTRPTVQAPEKLIALEKIVDDIAPLRWPSRRAIAKIGWDAMMRI